MITSNQSIKTIQKYAIWIKIALYYIFSIKVFTKTFQMILNTSNYCQIFDTSNYGTERPLPKGKNRKVTGLTKKWIRWKDYDWICKT